MSRQEILKSLIQLRLMRAKLIRSIYDLDEIIDTLEDQVCTDDEDINYDNE